MIGRVVMLGLVALAPWAAQARVWYVDLNTPDATPDGQSWAGAFPGIQQGIEAAFADGGGEVWVAWGVYAEARLVLLGEVNTGALLLRPGVDLYGGFRGDETARSQRDFREYLTAIDGSRSRFGLPAFHVVIGASAARIDGFAIRGGQGLSFQNANPYGGGIYNLNGASPEIANCTIHGNTSGFGGGIFSRGTAQIPALPTIENCRIWDNLAGTSGGGLYSVNAQVLMTNTLVYRNAAGIGLGGGLANESAQVVARHCVFWQNSAPSAGAFSVDSLSALNVANSIVWATEPLSIFDATGNGVTIRYSCVRGGFPSVGNTNISGDPRLALPNAGDFTLQEGSPCIDAANTLSVDHLPAGDLEGNPRPLRGARDMGAHEMPRVVYVENGAAHATENGAAWATAYAKLQDGIDDAFANGGEVWVARGVYGEARSADADGALLLRSGVAVYGDFAGYETARTQRILPSSSGRYALETVIDGSRARAGAPAYHVVKGASGARLDGFRIAGGRADGADARGYGGGLFNASVSPTLQHCQFAGNTALRGGGVYNAGGAPLFRDCLVAGNTATDGAGMANVGGSAVLRNTIFVDNEASGLGGALYSQGSLVSVVQCVIYRNTAAAGGGLYATSSGQHTVSNAIVRDNTPTQAATGSTGINSVAYSNIAQAGFGPGNIDALPRFYSEATPYDFRLRETSPCLDAGDFARATGHDADGLPRWRRTAPDMGAFEMPQVYYVNGQRNPQPQTGLTWISAFDTLQEGIDAAPAFDYADVWVARDTYAELRTYAIDGDNTGAVKLRERVRLFAGFAANETGEPDRDPAANPCIIDGADARDGNTATHVAVGADHALLDGFVIRNGQALADGLHKLGGGLLNLRTSPTIRNCTFHTNAAQDGGGGAYNFEASPVFANCVFRTNTGGLRGGAIFNDGGQTRLLHSTLVNNTATTTGGVSNLDAAPVVLNSVLWGNRTPQIGDEGSGATTVRHSDVQYGAPGTGNIEADPQFVSLAGRDYRLKATSPCVNAGLIQGATAEDMLGVLRGPAPLTEMGAFEVLDTDNDGLPDESEGAGDTDGDGTPDREDTDSDDDDLSDYEETFVYGTSPVAADTDGDGFDDGFEVANGTDPTTPEDGTFEPDVDGSGAVDALDIQLVINAALGLTVAGNPDVNNDGSVNALDVQLVINAALGLL